MHVSLSNSLTTNQIMMEMVLLYWGFQFPMIPITSSHTFISLPATSSASSANSFSFFTEDDKHDGMLEVVFPCVFHSFQPSFITVHAGRIAPSSCFVPLSNLQEFPAHFNLATCHKICIKNDMSVASVHSEDCLTNEYSVSQTKQHMKNNTQTQTTLEMLVKPHIYNKLCQI